MANIKSAFAGTSKPIEMKESGSGSKFSPPPTDVYTGIIRRAYLIQSKNHTANTDAHFMIELENGYELKVPMYKVICNGSVKGERKYADDYLIGFKTLTVACVCAARLTPEDLMQFIVPKKVDLWSYDAGKDVPTEVDWIEPLIGKKVKMALTRKISNKYNKPEEKIVESVVSIMADENGATYNEILFQDGKATALDKWDKANNGSDWDTFVKPAGNAGGNGAQGGAKKSKW